MGRNAVVFANGYDDNAVTRAGHAQPIIKVSGILLQHLDLICNEDVKILFYVLAIVLLNV